eukprot:CAMPEP_0196131858 /NCGR_PEP_ID=MMETSP0910-20130528/1688_1 /TAXON_ID=49265 /ORGANISM="Thalassiosira rotula, Strain GSO102" /LENGTH=594 /DNA_ID=CAMNT_0041391373 /DNA_START=500 /DNA_END=2285 /DNA_ORIENTATION=+
MSERLSVDIRCSRKNVLWGGIVTPSKISRFGDRSLLICRSTVSDETAEAEITITDNACGEINGALNGANGKTVPISINGNSSNSSNSSNSNGHEQPLDNNISPSPPPPSLDDVPIATANGGYTHTTSSKAKISAANKGKTPWNKGRQRSPEVKARIAEGVRRRNREKFLAKLAEEGITEEEHLERKKAERRKKEAERRARKTAKGGYTPTDETKAKISKILKEKYASGEVTRKPRDPSTVRRGFKHTEETKQKIRESLRKKWAEDAEYRELMTSRSVASGNVDPGVRQRISETLKKKWENPEFRAQMMTKFKNRKRSSSKRDASHRKKISDAMKKKWMDEEYRSRATAGMQKGRETAARNERNMVRMVVPVQPKMPKPRTLRGQESESSEKGVNGATAVQSLKPVSPIRKVVAVTKSATKSTTKSTTKSAGRPKATAKAKAKAKRKKSAAKRKSATNNKSEGAIAAADPTSSAPNGTTRKAPRDPDTPDDAISKMREERRDLYDLLYGDMEEDGGDGNENPTDGENNHAGGMGMGGGGGRGRPVNGESQTITGMVGMNGVTSNTMAALLGDDDDLDDFDPYGLHDTAPSGMRRA